MTTEQDYSPGDKVYFLYLDEKKGTQIKFAAVVLALQEDGLLIRVGRYDVDTREIRTFESQVDAVSLQPRSIPCAFEDALEGTN